MKCSNGALIKKVKYNSFGMLFKDTNPELFIPIGFAGGLLDRDTGLVRFGCRDYHPQLGRFLSPDPLGDTGGDHDVYDYCVDDPVSFKDPTGLFPMVLMPLGILAAQATGIGGGVAGMYLAQNAMDNARGDRTGRELLGDINYDMRDVAHFEASKNTNNKRKAVCTESTDALKKVLPKLLDIAEISATPVLATGAAVGGSAVPALIRKGGQRLGARKFGRDLIKTGEFAEGALNPNWSTGGTAASTAGTLVKKAYDEFQKNKIALENKLRKTEQFHEKNKKHW